jgi:hypothetical protein
MAIPSPLQPQDRGADTGESDTIVSVGERIDCLYFVPSDQSESATCFCTRFQIHPTCDGDLNRCDVLLNAPDPRDGYR